MVPVGLQVSSGRDSYWTVTNFFPFIFSISQKTVLFWMRCLDDIKYQSCSKVRWIAVLLKRIILTSHLNQRKIWADIQFYRLVSSKTFQQIFQSFLLQYVPYRREGEQLFTGNEMLCTCFVLFWEQILVFINGRHWLWRPSHHRLRLVCLENELSYQNQIEFSGLIGITVGKKWVEIGHTPGGSSSKWCISANLLTTALSVPLTPLASLSASSWVICSWPSGPNDNAHAALDGVLEVNDDRYMEYSHTVGCINRPSSQFPCPKSQTVPLKNIKLHQI